MPPAADHDDDRAADLRALDATFAGVHGLAASGITRLPRIFRAAEADDAARQVQDPPPPVPATIPVIDLSGGRAATVAAVGRAAAEWGFFQVTGHGVPPEVSSAAVRAARAFHEAGGGEGSEKARLYSRDPAMAVKYNCNFDLHQSKLANWRDTLYLRMAPHPPPPADMPDSCRDVFFDYAEQVRNLWDKLFGLLSEALGLSASHLSDMGCNKGQMILCHYYPPCPEPSLAVGTTRHSDSGFLTVLLQDAVGGLQVLDHGGRWLDVTPAPGAFIVNVGDLLQMVSNDRFRSAEHRVVLKDDAAMARVSIACFPSDPESTRMYGPIKELLSEENPALYRETLARDYVAHYYSLGLGPKMAMNDFRL